MRKDLLRTLLEIPTHSREEYLIVAFLKAHCAAHGYAYHVDALGNLFITKGSTDGFYPLVCAHTDSVHPMGVPYFVTEHGGNFMGFSLMDSNQVGIGGDDKAGVFVCLELLNKMPFLKVALFVSEEIGCVGSRYAEEEFFQDVGYGIEFDSPCNDIISFSCDGQQLFDEHGPLIAAAGPLLESHGAVRWQNHPFTDVAVLRRRFNFECLNLPCGYYKMHSDREYVCLADVENAIALGEKLISTLGNRKYVLKPGFASLPDRKVTGLIL